MSRKLMVLVIGVVLIFSFTFVTDPALAYDTSKVAVLNDYNPTLLPDSPFYFLKTWWEGIQELLTTNPVSKADLYLKLANKRMVEAEKLMEKGKVDLAKKLINQYQERIEKAIQKTEQAKGEGKDVSEIVAKLTANSVRQQEVLAKVYDKVPEQAKDTILNAMEESVRGLGNAIQNVQGIDKKQEFKEEVKDAIEKSGSTGQEKMKEKLQIKNVPKNEGTQGKSDHTK